MTPRCLPSGPVNAKAMIVGEAPGAAEDGNHPFLGTSGQELNKILGEAGLDRSEFRLTNVFSTRPPGNKLEKEWCVSKLEATKQYKEMRKELVKTTGQEKDWPPFYTWPAIAKAAYLKPEFLPELYRLREEINETKPNLIIACGGKATWALLQNSSITKIRGAVAESRLFGLPKTKVLPVFHPAYIMRLWDNRLILVCDMMKAKEQMQFPEIKLPQREIWINPDYQDLFRFQRLYIDHSSMISFDIETNKKQITVISFAPDPEHAIVVPFVDKTKPDYNYWPTLEDELLAWKWVKKILSLRIPKLAQNGLYDIQYLWRVHGIPVKNYTEDTMLLHHSLYPELQKGLGFMGSLYTDEVSWKLMRHRDKEVTDKKDD